ncbi:MAG: hypothetical protein AAF085_00635 [Planctomycetota bacterium]
MGQEHPNTSTGEPSPPGASPLPNQPLDLLSDLESRLGQLKDWQTQTDQQLREMQDESKRIDALREEAQEMQRACEERQRTLDSEKQQLDAELESLSTQEQQLNESRDALARDRASLDDARQSLENERGQTLTDREAIAQQQQALAQQQEEVRDRFAELESKENELNAQLEDARQVQAKADEQQQSIDAERETLRQEREALENWQQEIDQTRETFETQRAELAEQRESVDQQRKQLETEQAAVSQQRDELEQEKQLTERIKVDLKLKSETLEAQQRQLEETRQELVEQAMQVPSDAEEKHAELQSAKAELELAKEELEARHDELQAAMSDLDDRDKALTQRHEALAQREAQAATQQTGGSEQAEAIQQKLEELEQKRADLEQKREQFKQTLENSRQQIETERAQAHRREAELEARVKELEKNAGKSTAPPSSADDTAMRNRHAKLRRYRQLLRERSKTLQDQQLKVQSSSQQFSGLEKERQMLVEVKRFLEASEGEMVKRWAAGRAASIVMGALVTLVLAAAASFFAADQLVQPKWEASMMISVTNPEETVTPTTEVFLKSFEQTLLSEPVLNAALLEMDKADANVRVASTPDKLKAYLQDHLVIAGVPGRADLSLEGEDKQVLQPVLASLGKAVVGYNAAKDYQAKREPTTRIASPAKLVDLPIANGGQQKLTIAGGTFGGIILLALFAYIFLRIMLNRSKRMFGEEIEELTILDKPETWSPLHAANKQAKD